MKRAFVPTAEQQAVIEAALRLGNLKVKAFAGAGKTSTRQFVAEHFGQPRGTYLAFNRGIAASAARRFPPHVDSRTMHSLAWASASATLRSRVSLQGEPPHELAARYGLGLEWKRVKVANDFRLRSTDGSPMLDNDEIRLLYVAVTRAQHVLDISELRDGLLRLFSLRR